MTDYQPTEQLAAKIKAYADAQTALETARQALRAGVADDLKAHPDVTNDQMADHLPWTSETVRGIAREYDVPRKRKPTVRSIKGRKRAPAGQREAGQPGA